MSNVIKSVSFISRYEMKRLIKNNDPTLEETAIISINDSRSEAIEMNKLLSGRDFLITCFSDNDKIKFSHDEIVQALPAAVKNIHGKNRKLKRNYSNINLHEALRLIDFISRHKSGSFIIHCFMGISRSASVAKYIHKKHDHISSQLQSYESYNSGVLSLLQCVDKEISRLNE